jgi:membrane protein DedA with SNARE-associated domain
MTQLAGLGGPIAIVLIWLLVAVEEAGLPLPMFPGDGLLLTAGVLLATGHTSPWVFLPAAVAADVAGSLAGYAWARRLGVGGLERLAARFHAAGHLRRAADRLRRSGPLAVAVGRLLPGTRVYTNLVAGAVGIPLPVFLAGLLPSSAIWLAVFTGLGYVLGQQAAAYVHQAEAFALSLVVQFALVAALLYGLRSIRPPQPAGPTSPARLALAAALDTTAAVVIAATLRLVVVPRGIGVTVALVMSAVLYALAARVVAGSTAGEWLLEVSYAHELRRPRSGRQQKGGR